MKNSKTFKTIVEEFNYYLELRDSNTNTQEEIKKLIKDNDPLKRGYDLEKAIYPVNPLLVKRETLAPTVEEIEMLRKWISVSGFIRSSAWDIVNDYIWAAVIDSVSDYVWDAVFDSIWTPVWSSVRDYVLDSVWNTVEAYTASVFPNIKKWEGIYHEEGVNPFQPAIDLWERGLVASFNGTTWRLHAGEKAEVVYVLAN